MNHSPRLDVYRLQPVAGRGKSRLNEDIRGRQRRALPNENPQGIGNRKTQVNSKSPTSCSARCTSLLCYIETISNEGQ
jgi:hypothetical protein